MLVKGKNRVDKIKQFLVNQINSFKKKWFDQWIDTYFVKSYSQEGEDMILRRIFENRKNGFYVDIGAHHPKRFSNTYYFYQKGWTGINIDAMPGSMTLFNKIRPRDINIEKPISDKKEKLVYYSFNEPALNSFSKSYSEEMVQLPAYYIKEVIELETATLESVLDAYMPQNQSIDFLSVDVECWDLKVLQSNSFEKYKPTAILVEVLESSLVDIEKNMISLYLKELNYSVYAKAVNTVIFLRNPCDAQVKGRDLY